MHDDSAQCNEWPKFIGGCESRSCAFYVQEVYWTSFADFQLYGAGLKWVPKVIIHSSERVICAWSESEKGLHLVIFRAGASNGDASVWQIVPQGSQARGEVDGFPQSQQFHWNIASKSVSGTKRRNWRDTGSLYERLFTIFFPLKYLWSLYTPVQLLLVFVFLESF